MTKWNNAWLILKKNHGSANDLIKIKHPSLTSPTVSGNYQSRYSVMMTALSSNATRTWEELAWTDLFTIQEGSLNTLEILKCTKDLQKTSL